MILFKPFLNIAALYLTSLLGQLQPPNFSNPLNTTTEFFDKNVTVTTQINNKISVLGEETAVAPPKVLRDHREFVKLTMKQGLIMNQILGLYSLDKVDDPLCRNHMDEFRTGLRSFEPWALQMFDSSSKLQSGILLGNLMEFGSFQQCIRINHSTNSGQISGKYCLIKVSPSLDLIKKILEFRNVSAKRFPKIRIIVERSEFRWSVCVPNSCSETEVLRHFNKNIVELTQGLDLKVSLESRDCFTLDDHPKMGLTQFLVLAFLGLFIITAFVASAVTWKFKTPRNEFIDAFSIQSNYQRIVTSSPKNDLDCIHGMRFLSTCYVVIGHRYLMAMFFPVTNGLEILDWILNYSSTIIIGGTICVDTFFMLSGMLVSIGFFERVTKFGSFNIIAFYLYRYLRITPALAIVVLIYATLIQFLGSGPLWIDTYTSHQKYCQYYWWSTLLHIQNYINPDALCIIQVWYLSCDMLYYYMSPLVLYPIWRWPIFGIINYIVFYILSVAINFYMAWINEYEGGMPITNQLLETKYFQKHYIAVHTRASTYIIGLGLGYAIFKLKPRKIKINLLVNVSGWMVATAMMVSAVVGCHSFQLENHDYNRLESSIYLSCSRSAWTMGLVWMIWSCANNHGGIVNDVLTLHIFKVLGRISYGIFLLHMIFQFLKCGANKMPIYFSNFSSIYDSLADLVFMIIAGFFFTVFYELPLVKLAAMFLKPDNRKVKPNI